MIQYVVIKDITVKTHEDLKALKNGQIIKIAEKSACQLIERGFIKPLPYITGWGSLVIPHNSPECYHWWNGGQSVLNTLLELAASPEVLAKYK